MQKSLFPELEKDLKLEKICKDASGYISIYEKRGIPYEIVDIEDVTFKGGTSEAIHSWFRLTPSYSPQLVRHFLKDLDCDYSNLILDPFNGKGTTVIECQKQGYKSIGVELNPLLSRVTGWSLGWDMESEILSNYFDQIRDAFFKMKEELSDLDIGTFCQKTDTNIPPIHNPLRWWKEEVLKDLLTLKKVIAERVRGETESLFKMILTVISLDCANIHRNHPTISFDDNHNRKIDVWGEFEMNFSKVRRDLEAVQKIKNIQRAEIIEGDSTELNKYVNGFKIDRVITSPPYPNRFSYIHTTRPQLFFMEIIDNANDATEIDIKAIGGTWGRATSILQKEFLQPNQGIENFLDYLPALRGKSLLMCNYATKYFNMMHDHIKSLKKVANKPFKGVYVVGNSRLSDVEIHTEVILADIFQKEGFKLDKIAVFRKRGGKRKLYETGVCVIYN